MKMEAAEEDTEHPQDSLHFQNDHELDKKMSPDPFEQIEKKQEIILDGINTKLTRLEE